MSADNEVLVDFYDEEALKDSITCDLEHYTQSRKIGQYTPNGRKPSYTEMVDETRYRKLVEDIEKSNVSEQDKYFLKMAATRHLKFTYKNIADYYANSSPEVQKLMEDSILVIIDYDDALANGYIRMSNKIDDIAKQDILKNLEMRKEKEKNGFVYRK